MYQRRYTYLSFADLFEAFNYVGNKIPALNNATSFSYIINTRRVDWYRFSVPGEELSFLWIEVARGCFSGKGRTLER